ncbi:VWA domain-containing protein [Actinacidiphila sp. ITFR-21]|uniref:VWA domain-containing protein n=1 Tax=Actinacidiphila sp. ITFR-21 TaxID=3075199 RepID=UPI00288A31AF|nr:VWA domain-containing protein [Streptomyces sp. ITFR-21]WNI19349.1 substrate-binding domain-containing protein [Streptomyces sp. ITFR-21]
MGRHGISRTDRASSSGGSGARASRHRGRTAALTTILVLAVGAGTFGVLRGGLLSVGGTCHAGTVRIDAAASPDIAPVLTRIADRARAEHATTDGQCLDVRVTARDSAQVADELGGAATAGAGTATPGRPRFAVWIPDDSIWVNQLATSGQGTSVSPMGTVARSPVVVGALRAQADALGWPAKTYTWAELTGVAADTRLRLGSTDPAHSATGMLALAMINTSIIRSAGGESADTDTQSAGAAKLLAQRTAPTAAQALATLPGGNSKADLADPAHSQALVLSEQAAFAHNGGTAPALRLFYPKDGAAALDYPYTLVDDMQQTVDQSRAATRFLSLLGDADSLRELTAAGFRAPAGGPPPALVQRAGGQSPQPVGATPAPAPSAADLQKLRLEWQITVQSARITTVVDVSGSMATPVPGSGKTRLDVTKASLEQALGQFTDQDEIGLWRFSTRLDGSRDYQKVVPTGRLGAKSGGTTGRQRLDAAFKALKPVPDGSTGLYDTALAVYQDASTSYAAGRFNAVVILTDGANEDPGSIPLGTLTTKLKALGDPTRPVPLIAIAVGPDADKSACDKIAEATGGAAYRVNDPGQIQAVLLKAVVAAATSAAAKAP